MRFIEMNEQNEEWSTRTTFVGISVQMTIINIIVGKWVTLCLGVYYEGYKIMVGYNAFVTKKKSIVRYTEL